MNQFQKYLIDVDKNLDVLKADAPFFEYLGNIKLANLDQIIPPQDLMQLKNAIFAIDPGMPGLTCFRIRTSAGTLNWIAANVWKKGEYGELISMELSDIQTLKTDANSMQNDEMTGLLNKQAIREFTKELTEKESTESFYFCLLDIDHFKNVNDTFGHACGDEVIIDVAHIIADSVGDYGKVGRIGGDEFMFALDKVNTKPHLREILASIRSTVERKYKKFKGSIDVTVSIGAAMFPDYAVDFDNLFELTDKMLYRAKEKGRNRYIIYTPEIHGDLDGLVKVANVTAIDSGDKEDKLKLILGMFDRFLLNRTMTMTDAMAYIMKAYDLDEVAVFEDGLEKSTYAIRRVEKEKDYDIENYVASMPFIDSHVFRNHFSINHVAMVNVFDLSREDNAELIDYMERNDRHHVLVYQMQKNNRTGYVVFISARENSRRQSLVETNDLVYFSRMIELLP